MSSRLPRVAFSILVLCAARLSALLPEGPEFQVNSYSLDAQKDSKLCQTADGGFVVVWESDEQDGDSSGVFGQRYSPGGSEAGGEFLVNTYTTGIQDDAGVCCKPGGGFVVVWRSNQDGSSYGVFGRLFDAAGASVGSVFQVNTYTTSEQQDSTICCRSDDSFVVAWESYQDGSSGGVFAQRFNASASPIGGEFQINTYTLSGQNDPSVCCRNDDGFVVAWQSYLQDGGETGVFAQRFSSAGAPAGNEFQVNTYTTGFQDDQTICCRNDDGFVVLWEGDGAQDGDQDGILGQRFTGAGAPEGAEFQVNTHTFLDQGNPAVCCTSAGGFIAVWQSEEFVGNGNEVLARAFDAAGVGEDDFLVNVTTFGEQDAPAIACCDDDLDALVTWDSGSEVDTQDGDNEGVFSRFLGEPVTILEVPTLSRAGILALALTIAAGALLVLRRSSG